MKFELRAFFACLMLAILHTWPLGMAPATRSLNWHADAELNEWELSWIDHTLPRDPAHLFDGDIFAPERDTLAYTDPLIVPALVAAPVYWLTGSPVLTFNASLILGLTLTAWAGWFVAWRWTGSWRAALVGGALTAFNVHLLTRFAHVQAAHSWGVPLAIYFADRIANKPTWRAALALALVTAATAATSLYTLTFVAFAVAIVGLSSGRWRHIAAVAAAVASGLLLAVPVLLPYIRLAADGITRPIGMVAQFSATPLGYLTSTTRIDAEFSRQFFRDDVNVLFAGFAALALASVGAIASLRDRSSRRRSIALIVLAAVCVLLSFGPATSVYRGLYAYLPPMRGLRTVARFGYMYLVVVALFAGAGVAALEKRMRAPWSKRLVPIAALAIVTIEAWSGLVPTVPFHGVPGIYRELLTETRPVLLVEVPFYPTDAMSGNGEYVLNATAHWLPLANGTSGFLPDSYRQRSAAFWNFPRDWAIDAIEKDGATDIMVHLEHFTPDEVTDIDQVLTHRPELRLVATDGAGHRLYRVR